MGLDMYLETLPVIKGKTIKQLIAISNGLTEEKQSIIKKYEQYIVHQGDTCKWKSLLDRVGYWRKANAIHNWFVNNVQNGKDDCGTYPVHRNRLEELLQLCTKVLKLLDNAQKETIDVSVGIKYVDGKPEPVFEKHEIYTKDVINKVYKLLPPVTGFFFGSQLIDSYYYDDIYNTIKIINHVLTTVDFQTHYIVYSSSW